MSDLTQLSEEEASLLKRLDEIRREKAEAIRIANEKRLAEIREKERSEPIVVRVFDVNDNWGEWRVWVKSRYRDDLVAVYQTIPSRQFVGSQQNSFLAEYWPQVVEKLSTLKNVTIEYADGMEERIKKAKSEPVWYVDFVDRRRMRAVPSKRASTFILRSVPGAEWITEKQVYFFPLSEAHTVWARLDGVEGVVWSDEAKEFVLKQLERRANLDKIATMDIDPEYAEFDLNGMRLRPFQTVGSRFLEEADGKALLGHEMGLGKTPMVIAYAHKMGFKKVIVVAPAALKPNWYREILKFTGKKAKVLYGAAPGTYDMLSVVPVDAEHEWFIINYDILRRKVTEPEKTGVNAEGYTVTYPETERFLWVELINMANPDLVIVDEGHYIKNMDTNQSQAVRSIKAPRIVFMTGTPVLNRPGELFPMLTMIDPEQFPAYETFLKQYTYDGKVARNVDELKSVLKAIMIRKLKTEVFPDLPKVDRRLIYHELSPKAVKAYKRIMAGIYDLVEDFTPGRAGDSVKVTNILAQIQRLKMVSAIDKAERTAELAQELYEQTDESEHRKVIIFTQYKGVAHKISRLLGKAALSFVTRRGSEFVTADANERDRLVQQFQTDSNIQYLVVTEKTTKEGHNITAAGHVVFNDLFWNPGSHDQAIGRAYGRISDMHGVDAYFLIGTLADSEESIEEWIWELLNFKQGVIDEVVEGVENSRNASIAMALIEKVREAMGAYR